MYIIYEVSAFPAMINQPATLLEPRAFEARPEGNTFFFRNFPSFFPFRSQISRIFEPLPPPFPLTYQTTLVDSYSHQILYTRV